MRKPHGGPADLSETFSLRHSLCCGREGCRRRTLPPSVLFLGRRGAQNLVHALTQAMLKRGLPRALMTDNGSAMLAEETREGLARLGVSHDTTLPYSPYMNGKQEVFWAQLEGRLMELLRGVSPLRLEFLNRTNPGVGRTGLSPPYPQRDRLCSDRASARRTGGLPFGSRHGLLQSRLHPPGHAHPAQKRCNRDGRGGALRGPVAL